MILVNFLWIVEKLKMLELHIKIHKSKDQKGYY